MKKYLISTFLLSVNVLIFSYLGVVLFNINKGFFQGYAGTEVEIDLADAFCFYYRAGIVDIIKVGKEANYIKSSNFNYDSFENVVNLIQTLNSIKKRVNPCLQNIKKVNKEDSKYEYFKKVGLKFLEIVPFGSKLKAGFLSIDMALQFKELVNLLDAFRLYNFMHFWKIHENSEIVATAVGRLCYTLDGLFDNEDIKIVKELLNLIQKA